MKPIFEVTYVKYVNKVKTASTLTVPITFTGRECNIGYGFESHFYNCQAKEGGKVERYRLHSAIIPCQVIQLKHIKSGRIFTLGKSEGFLHYTTDILENNIKVGTLHWESYYKD